MVEVSRGQVRIAYSCATNCTTFRKNLATMATWHPLPLWGVLDFSVDVSTLVTRTGVELSCVEDMHTFLCWVYPNTCNSG